MGLTIYVIYNQSLRSQGSRICGPCPPGYIGDGNVCTLKGVCAINNGGCHHYAQCRDNSNISPTYVECICPSSYVGSGIGPNGCVPKSDMVNPCTENPCVHGTCISNNDTGTYTCSCSLKYTGKHCDIRKNPCQPNPCTNGGTCISIMEISYKCVCTNSYTGDICDKEKQACGGVLRGQSGTLRYPMTQTTSYNHQISCAWIILTNLTKVVNITFTKFNLETSNNCRYDWLQIHDGRNSAARSLGRFCGTTLPNGGNIVSTHNVIYLWFRSDSTISKHGFELNWTVVDPVCGGTVYVTSHGSLHSPGFPGNYPTNRDCYWTLSTQPGKRFQFHFYSLIIGENSDCNEDYLSIHQGYSTTDRVLAKYCNTSHPEPLYSGGSDVFIHFHSDALQTYPGFQIAYSVVGSIPGCGGVFTSNEGELYSPSVKGQYPPDLICEYKIQVLEQSRIKITFLKFDLEEDEECYYDYLEIYEGGSILSPLIGRYCGNILPRSYTSIGNQLFIVFTSDWGNSEEYEEGFILKYETICGGIYSEPTGIIESPGYPSYYTEDQICIYEIIQPLGTSILLTFLDFHMEESSYPVCLFDFVEIRNGDNDNSTLIGQYCKSAPPDIQSTYNYLWIKFESDSSGSGKGFQANYTTVNMGCGGILKENAGVVKSPEHPDYYQSDLICMWIIVAPPGDVIQLTWLLFNLEESNSCSFDYVEIYNSHVNNELVGRFCGSKPPPVLVSSSNTLTIKFVTDSSINYDGFMASYIFTNELSACGGKYFTSSGVIKSPFYPEKYPASRDCSWVITVNLGQQILLNVTDFSLELASDCNFDYLEIRNGGTSSSPLIGKYCGTSIPREIPSHTNQIHLFFHSDMSRTESGFKISWVTTATGCGGLLTSPKGAIISPYYPEPYTENTDCVWKISVNLGSLIQVVFADIDLENHANCKLDFVEIFDGKDLSAKSLGRFCSGLNVPFIRSNSNLLTILFRSDGGLQQRGFHIQYSTVCHNTVKGFRGIIESPNFPNNYPQLQDCRWKIEVTNGNKINISFSHFNLERAESIMIKNCSFNFLEIRYSSTEGEMITSDTLCGVEVPSLISINSHIAEIHFASDSSLVGNGFRLEWQIEGCGGLLTHPVGRISTPNYPNGYPQATVCEWIIQTEYGSSIEITFTDVDFEISTDCNLDYVLVTNGLNDSYPTLAKLCSKGKKPLITTSTGNTMFIRFESDYTYYSKGFLAHYKTISSKCGGTLSVPQGSFHSPNYPRNYDLSDRCEWLIDIEDNHIIELLFVDIDLGEDCNTDFIKIYDGPTVAYPLLHKLCGNTNFKGPIKSTYNHMIVELQTGSIYSAKGFLANYTMGCGARIVTQSSGIIQFTHTSLASTRLENCSWTIVSSHSSEHVSLMITHLEATTCYGDEYPLRIYGGESNQSPLIAQYCELKLPLPITSMGNALHVELNTAQINFMAKYYMLDSSCGGVLTGAAGYFATPRYPNNYPINIECEWTLQVAPGNRISLYFKEFDLVSSENCHINYLEIRSKNSYGKLLGTYCDEKPLNISEIGSLWILFKSESVIEDDSGTTGKGFLAEYSLVHGIDIFGQSGQIASPLYPQYFINGGEYAWTITVTFGKAISLTFLDFYFKKYSETECSVSVIYIYDGMDANAPLLKELCGLSIPESVKSTSNVIYINAIFDSFLYGSKFLLEWLEIDIDTEIQKHQNKIEGCGSQTIIDLSDIWTFNLTSPGYPYGYDVNLNCVWIFSTQPGYHLEIDFKKVDLENFDGQCILDYVNIYNGMDGTQNWNLHSTICFTNASSDDQLRSTNLMKVVFSTNGYSNLTGFEAEVIKRCGGSLNGPNGIVTIDRTKQEHFDTCEWNVTVRSGRKIRVEFLELDLSMGLSKDCYSYVMLKNGHYLDSPILGIGKYCDNTIPEPLTTTSNYLYIKYNGYLGKYFRLSYTELSSSCGGSITLSKFERYTSITSPNYPNIPPPYTECFWTIAAPPGESLRIDFEERLDVTESEGCEVAAVEIRDGGSKYAPLLGRHCLKMPNSTFSSSNMVNVRFFTNVEVPRNGFKINVSIATCGGVIRSEEGDLQSPNYKIKKMYPKNSNCIWHIVGPEDHYLTLNFLTLDLELPTTINCNSGDYILIQEPFIMNNTLQEIGTYCNNKNPGDIKTSGNKVIIQFVTKGFGNLRDGFKLHFKASEETCGGNMNTESGIVQSPGYPNSQYSKRECEWLITVPEGRRITFQFIDLDIDLEDFQGLVFFNDKTYRSVIKYIMQYNSTEVIESSGNVMYIIFWNTIASSQRGFKAEYSSNEPTICEGNLNLNSGIIKNVNSSTYYCLWKHIMEHKSNKTLSMSITTHGKTNLDTKSCKYALSGIIITTDIETEIIARYCRNIDYPIIIRSPYPVTKLIGYQNKEQNIFQYTVKYETHPCGGIITNQAGIITTPGYPNKYLYHIECAWALKMSDDERIQINFDNVNLDSNCENNYIIIYNGMVQSSPKIGHFCANNKPTTIKAGGSELLIEYHAAEKSTGIGFKLTYESFSEGCGGVFFDSTRVIQTPMYPKDYPNNAECIWEIIGQNGFHISLNFIDRFYIEESENCRNDFIEVWDYSNDTWQSLGKNCGRNTPQRFNTTSNKMKVMFRSNDKIKATGFKANWTQYCGGTFKAHKSKQYIYSPGYPNEYENSIKCIYKIVASNSNINIVFEDFALEAESTCQFDNVTVQSKSINSPYSPYSLAPKVYCGTNPPLPMRIKDEVIVTFTSDAWIAYEGFKISYKIDECGGEITEPTTISLKSHNSDNTYLSTVECVWNITAPIDKNVVVRFTSFQLEHNLYCAYDYVAVYEGLTVNESSRLALLCGNLSNHLPVIKSKSNSLTVLMKTDYTNHFDDFTAAVYFNYGPKDNCGGTIFVENTEIVESSTGLANLDCHWTLIAKKDHVLKIRFSDIHLPPCITLNTTKSNITNCACHIIEIRDGSGPFSDLMYQLCDNTIPPELTSSGHTMWLRLYTLGSTVDKAFKATVTQIPSICGPSVLNVTNQTQVLTSPNFPNPYPNNIKCTWLLKHSEYYRKFALHFTEFDLVSATDGDLHKKNCDNDRVEIVDKTFNKIVTEGLGPITIFNGKEFSPIYGDFSSPVGVQQYCGRHAMPFTHYSGENEVTVSFHSGFNTVHGKGFKMEYRLAGCDRNFTTRQGRIMDTDVKQCTITITAPANYSISIYFLTFFFYESDDCKDNGFVVYDGETKAATKIAQLCSYSIPNPIYSTTNKLQIEVWNNKQNSIAMYDAVFTSSPFGQGCGGIFYNYGGKFTSPLYPSSYRKNKTCTWKIQVPQGMHVALKFTVFDITEASIRVTTYNKDDTTSVHVFRKNDNPAVLRSESNVMEITYTTSLNNGGTGWIAHFLAITEDAKLQWNY